MPVGVFDSGIGGLTVATAIGDHLPDQGLVYLGDNAFAPYGVRDAEQIYDLTCKGCARLFDEGCDLIILACNTASSVALKRMQETWIREPGVSARAGVSGDWCGCGGAALCWACRCA